MIARFWMIFLSEPRQDRKVATVGDASRCSAHLAVTARFFCFFFAFLMISLPGFRAIFLALRVIREASLVVLIPR